MIKNQYIAQPYLQLHQSRSIQVSKLLFDSGHQDKSTFPLHDINKQTADFMCLWNKTLIQYSLILPRKLSFSLMKNKSFMQTLTKDTLAG